VNEESKSKRNERNPKARERKREIEKDGSRIETVIYNLSRGLRESRGSGRSSSSIHVAVMQEKDEEEEKVVVVVIVVVVGHHTPPCMPCTRAGRW
jgi:hypothetical protein